MIDLIPKIIKEWLCIRIAKNPSPELEDKIEEGKVKLHEQISLLRLSNSELIQTSKNLRFNIMQELINDIARHK